MLVGGRLRLEVVGCGSMMGSALPGRAPRGGGGGEGFGRRVRRCSAAATDAQATDCGRDFARWLRSASTTRRRTGGAARPGGGGGGGGGMLSIWSAGRRFPPLVTWSALVVDTLRLWLSDGFVGFAFQRYRVSSGCTHGGGRRVGGFRLVDDPLCVNELIAARYSIEGLVTRPPAGSH